MKPSEYIKCDALGLAELVHKGEVTPDELLDTALTIAKQVEPQIGSLCHVEEEAARKRIKAGLPHGVFTGVPFVFKDIKVPIEDVPMSMGSQFFANTKSPMDGEIAKRCRATGMTIFGRSTTSELALYIGTEAKHCYGYDTANPWHIQYSPGGSSGGAAAAVAAGIMPMAHATDAAGSIRLPAGNCGLLGLKPTKGLLPTGPIIGDMWGGLLTEGIVSRSVRDHAAFYDAVHGMDSGAPYYGPPVAETYLDAVQRKPRKQKIAYMKNMFGGAVTPEVQEAIEKTAKLCVELGHEVAEYAPEFDIPLMFTAMFTVMWLSTAMTIEDRATALGRMPGPNDLEPATLQLWKNRNQLSSTDYVRAIANLQKITRIAARFFEKYDMLLTPIGSHPSMPLGYCRDHPPEFTVEALKNQDFSSYAFYEPFANMTGNPAACIPAYWSKDNMPIGSHFIARCGEDATLLQLAAQLEEANPWFHRLPEMTKQL